MIKYLKVAGFRSLKDVGWTPGALNVVIGPNGSGKSNLLRALELLQQGTTGDLESAIVKRGGITAIAWDGTADELIWKLESDSPQLLSETFFGRKPGNLTYELELENLGVGGNFYRIVKELLADYSKVERKEAKEPFKYLERDQNHAVVFDAQDRKLIAPPDRVAENQTLLSQMSGVFASPLPFFFRQFIEGWGIYRDLVVHDQATVRQATVTRREFRLASGGQNLVAVLHTLYTTDRDFRDRINDAMRAAFGKDFEEILFPPAEDQRVQMRIRWRSLQTEQSTQDLSDGTIRFLMLATILARPHGSLIAIDEPESSLHPSMFPILADLAADVAPTTQVFFMTHSPQFLSAIGTKSPTTTVAQNVDGQSNFKVVDGNELKRWLDRYSLGQLFESGELEALA